MDLSLFASVIWRFKYLIVGGLVVASTLSVLTIAKVDLGAGAPYLSARVAPRYASNATVLVTQPGAPWTSAVQQYRQSSSGGDSVPIGDLGRLTTLANLYVQIANSDIIKAMVARTAPAGGTVSAAQNYSFSPSYYSSALPIMTLTGTGKTRADAITTTRAGVTAMIRYLTEQQRQAGIKGEQRVVIQVLQQPHNTVVVDGPKKTLPVVVFLTVMLAVVGLAFALANVRPRVAERPAVVSDPELLVDSARRSA